MDNLRQLSRHLGAQEALVAAMFHYNCCYSVKSYRLLRQINYLKCEHATSLTMENFGGGSSCKKRSRDTYSEFFSGVYLTISTHATGSLTIIMASVEGITHTYTQPHSMTSQKSLTVALVLALSSNAVLLLILLLKSSDVAFFKDQTSLTLEQAARLISARSGGHLSNFIHREADDAEGVEIRKGFTDTSQRKVATSHSSAVFKDRTSDNHLLLRLLKYQLLQSENQWEDVEHDYFDVSDSSKVVSSVPPNLNYLRQQHHNQFLTSETDNKLRTTLRDSLLSTTTQSVGTLDTAGSTNTTMLRIPQKTLPEVGQSYLNLNDPHDDQSANLLHQIPKSELYLKRMKREADAPSGETASGGRTKHRMHAIFSTFTDGELAKFAPAVYDLLIPALVHFETMIIRDFESLHSVVIAHDLRLEELEKSILNIMNRNGPEPQSDATDNKSELDNPSQILGKSEEFLPAYNNSEVIEMHMEIDSSGDGEWGPTQTTASPPSTAIQNMALYDMYRIQSTLEQKVMALENYNIMSDSELTRVRSEVVKMDDKVTELDRRQRNLQIRTSMHTQKITELEVYMSKSELGIHTALDSYSRVNSRLEAFKDRLAEFKNSLQAVAVQFGRHDQISNELRAADSYKAHDIQEMRKSVFSIEGRLNGLYRVLDHNLDTVRTDLRAMLDRLCANNKLAC